MTPSTAALKVYTFLEYVLKRALALSGMLIFIRIVLKFFAANPASYIVEKLYANTDLLLWPFQGIFSNMEWEGHAIDIVGACAILGYAILVFLILQLLKMLTRQ